MVKEEILTSLRNAVSKGESLDNAKKILINSGYNSNEVEEASHYIRGVSGFLAPKKDEQLVMPNEKSFIRRTIPTMPIQKPIQPLIQKPIRQIPAIAQAEPNYNNFNTEVRTSKPNYIKEMILFIILLLLIIGLAFIFIYKDTLLSLFSGL